MRLYPDEQAQHASGSCVIPYSPQLEWQPRRTPLPRARWEQWETEPQHCTSTLHCCESEATWLLKCGKLTNKIIECVQQKMNKIFQDFKLVVVVPKLAIILTSWTDMDKVCAFQNPCQRLRFWLELNELHYITVVAWQWSTWPHPRKKGLLQIQGILCDDVGHLTGTNIPQRKILGSSKVTWLLIRNMIPGMDCFYSWHCHILSLMLYAAWKHESQIYRAN